MIPGLVKRGQAVTIPTSVVVIPGPRVAGNAPHKGNQTPRVHVQAPADVPAEQSPPPTPYSAFAGIGHVTHARWLDQVLAIGDKLSIRAWEGAGSQLVQKVPSALVIGMPPSAGMNPVRESVNIEQPQQTTLSALATLRPQAGVSFGAYRKLG